MQPQPREPCILQEDIAAFPANAILLAAFDRGKSIGMPPTKLTDEKLTIISRLMNPLPLVLLTVVLAGAAEAVYGTNATVLWAVTVFFAMLY